MGKLGFGDSEEAAWKEQGVSINAFDSHGEIVKDSNKLVFVYILNGAKVEEGSHATTLHVNIIGPVIRDMKGMIDVIMLDCSHP